MGISVVNKQKPDVLPHLRLPPNSTLIHPSFPLAENVTVIFAAIISPEAKSVGSEELPSWLHTFPGGFHGRWCWSHKRQRLIPLTSLLRMQWTMTMTNPSKESKTAKRIWKSAERRSVMARTADIQVRASRGSTTQELHRDALSRERDRELSSTSPFSSWDSNPASPPPRSRRAVEDFSSQRLRVGDLSWAPLPGEQEEALHTHTAQTRGGDNFPKSAVMHKTGGGEEGCRSLPPSPFPHCPSSTTTAFPEEREQNTITAGCQGEGEQLQQRLVCHDGCQYSGHRHLDFHSTWKTPTAGRVTLSSDSNGQAESWCADWNICIAPLLYTWWSPQHWELWTWPHFPGVRKFAAFLCDLPRWCFGKKTKLFVPCLTIFVSKFIPVWTLTWDSSHISIHRTENWPKQVPGISTLAVNAKRESSSVPRDSLGIHLSNPKKNHPKQF